MGVASSLLTFERLHGHASLPHAVPGGKDAYFPGFRRFCRPRAHSSRGELPAGQNCSVEHNWQTSRGCLPYRRMERSMAVITGSSQNETIIGTHKDDVI